MKVANFLYILSWALVATITSGSPLTNDPSLSRRSKAMSVANNPLSRRANPITNTFKKAGRTLVAYQGAVNAVNRGISKVGGAFKTVDRTMNAAKAAVQNVELAGAAKGHECNIILRHVISGTRACCPAYHSCISTRRDAGQCGSEYNACKAGRRNNGPNMSSLRKEKLTGGDCADPTKAATPEGRACCPARAQCIKRARSPEAIRECESTFVRCLGQNGA